MERTKTTFERIEVGVEVSNASYFAITVAEFGLYVRDEESGKWQDYVLDRPNKRIEARDLFILKRQWSRNAFRNGQNRKYFHSLITATKGYVRLATGQRIEGKDKELQSFAESVREFAKQEGLF
jgi:hypothetical protein